MNLPMLRDRFLGYVYREFKTLADYKIIYEKPVKLRMWHPLKTGDRGLDFKISEKDLAVDYEKLPLLQTTQNEAVKKLFSLEYMSRKAMLKMKKKQAMDVVKRHDWDHSSIESQIASLTVKIQDLQQFIEEMPRCTAARINLKHLVDRRRHHLIYLRMSDYRKFEWLLEKLNLEFRPMPVGPKTVTRKNALRMMTEKTCEKIRNKKLDEYKAQLQDQLDEFYTEKLKALEFIMKEEAELGVTPTVTEEDIAAVKEGIEKARLRRAEKENAKLTPLL